MKICLLGDTHFGVRNDSKIFHKYFEKFYSNIFFPALKEHGIEIIVQLGDLFDRRKYINFLTLSESKRYFFNELRKREIELHVLIGNHDIFWRENLGVNSPNLLLNEYSNILIYEEPTTLKIGQMSIDIIPWICKDNQAEILKFIENTESNHCLGHFEISGYEMMKGVESHEGIDKNLLKKYKHVYSGHFHTASSKGNITYLGTPYELMWSDCNDPRGFYILDTVTEELEFIKNPYTIFTKYYYNEYEHQPLEEVEDKFIKIIVVDKKDYNLFDNFVENLYKNNPSEVKIIEDMSEFESSAVDDNINLEDTMTLLSEYVDGLETDADKLRLKTILRELYVEAHDYEET